MWRACQGGEACQAHIVCNLDSAAQVLLLGVGHLVDLWLCQVWVVQDVVQQRVSMVLHVLHLVLQDHERHEQGIPIPMAEAAYVE